MCSVSQGVAAAAVADANVVCVSARTGQPVHDRAAHEASYAHQLQKALLRRLCCPEQPLPWRSIYDELTNTSRRVGELHHGRCSRRLAKQHAALRFLRRHNVLMHGLLFYVAPAHTWNCTSEFARLALYGEAVLRSEVQTRTSRLLPHLPAAVYMALLRRVLCSNSFSSLFDTLHLEQIVGARPPSTRAARQQRRAQRGNGDGKASADAATTMMTTTTAVVAQRLTCAQKASMLCALVGEMHWFAARTRATERTHNNALFPPSDVLILHVLCTHLLECLPAELILREVAPCLRAVRAAWVNEHMSLPSQLYVRPRPLSGVYDEPTARAASDADAAAHGAATTSSVSRCSDLSPVPIIDAVRSTMRPRFVQRRRDGDEVDDGAAEHSLEAHRSRCAAAVALALHDTSTPRRAHDAATSSPVWDDARGRALVREAYAAHFAKQSST